MHIVNIQLMIRIAMRCAGLVESEFVAQNIRRVEIACKYACVICKDANALCVATIKIF